LSFWFGPKYGAASGGVSWSEVKGLLVLVLALVCGLALGPLEVRASELLVYSPTLNLDGQNQASGPQGKIVFSVRSFSPVTSIELNGVPVSFRPSARLNLEVPYRLELGENRFFLKVTSAQGSETRSFSLYLPKPEEEPVGQGNLLSLYGSLGTVWEDNPERVNPGVWAKKPATKLQLVLLPVYTEPYGADQELLYSAVLIRERYFSDLMIVPELFFNQLALDWQQRLGGLTWSLGVGANEIADQATGVLELAEANRHIEAQQLVRGKLKWELSSQESLSAACELTKRNAALNLGPRYDYDGLTKTCDLGGDLAFDPYRVRVELGSVQNDSLGDLQDYGQTRFQLGWSAPWDKNWTLKGTLGRTGTRYLKYDPLKLAQENTTQTTLALGGNYQPPGAEYLWTLEGRQTNQSSNVDFLRYQQNRLSLSLVFHF